LENNNIREEENQGKNFLEEERKGVTQNEEN
jgi:hypothetical protein